MSSYFYWELKNKPIKWLLVLGVYVRIVVNKMNRNFLKGSSFNSKVVNTENHSLGFVGNYTLLARPYHTTV